MEDKALNYHFRSNITGHYAVDQTVGHFLGMDRIVGASFKSELDSGGWGGVVFSKLWSKKSHIAFKSYPSILSYLNKNILLSMLRIHLCLIIFYIHTWNIGASGLVSLEPIYTWCPVLLFVMPGTGLVPSICHVPCAMLRKRCILLIQYDNLFVYILPSSFNIIFEIHDFKDNLYV